MNISIILKEYFNSDIVGIITNYINGDKNYWIKQFKDVKDELRFNQRNKYYWSIYDRLIKYPIKLDKGICKICYSFTDCSLKHRRLYNYNDVCIIKDTISCNDCYKVYLVHVEEILS